MDTCVHVDRLHVASDHSISDPSKWMCSQCGTTEWVWACLSCPNVACGRMNQQHALHHFQTTKHPIAIEVNEKYVYCYVCDEYVTGDNSCGDLSTLRSALTAISGGCTSGEASGDSQGKGCSLLRSYSQSQEKSWSQSDDNDRLITAEMHYKKSLLAKAFSVWQEFVVKEKKQKISPATTSVSPQPPMLTRAGSSLCLHVKKRALIPGVTGMRNLGNTCYINSVIQALGHLEDFREFFCQLVFGLFSPSSTPVLPDTLPPESSDAEVFSPSVSTSKGKPGSPSKQQVLRLTSLDYFNHLNTTPPKPTVLKNEVKSKRKTTSSQKASGGLNGGGSSTSSHELTDMLSKHVQSKAVALKTLSLCQELHGLLRVLWSGKWAQVSPHSFLHAVWGAIPQFKGHSQHDAQEFLCELLDKLSQEMEQLPQSVHKTENIVDQKFRGELVSQVTCMKCQNLSSRHEPFLDLSLEFPSNMQTPGGRNRRHMCHITEMLSTFTSIEHLDPSSYACENCNKKRRKSSIRTDAKKQLLINESPEILRLHLKRFRWCGRNNREKIGTHVAFDEELDISPFCLTQPELSHYRLNAVVVHHGQGFRAGHYTTYTFNNEAESWVHCNDSRVQLVPIKEVLKSQAYILIYTRRLPCLTLDEMPVLNTASATLDTDCNRSTTTLSTIPDLDCSTMNTLRQLSRGETIRDEEVSLNFHRDPTLIRRLSGKTKTAPHRICPSELSPRRKKSRLSLDKHGSKSKTEQNYFNK